MGKPQSKEIISAHNGNAAAIDVSSWSKTDLTPIIMVILLTAIIIYLLRVKVRLTLTKFIWCEIASQDPGAFGDSHLNVIA